MGAKVRKICEICKFLYSFLLFLCKYLIDKVFLRCEYTNVPYINRISTVVDSGRVAEGTCPLSPPKGGKMVMGRRKRL